MSDIPRKSIETFSFRILNQVLAVSTSIVLARALGPFGKGLFSYAGTIMSVILTISAGEAAAISWQYGRLKRPSGDVLSAMFMFAKYVGIAIAIIVAVVALVVPGQQPLLAVAVALPFAFLSNMAVGFFLADGNVRVCNIQALIAPASFLIIALPAMLIWHAGIAVVLAIWAASFVPATLHALDKLRPYDRQRHIDPFVTLRDQVVFGSKVTASALVGLLNFRIDIFIILFMLGPKALGVYSVAIGFGELLWQLSRPLAFSAFRTVVSGTKAEAAALTAKCVRHSLAMVSLSCLLLFFFGPFLITLVYGPAFSGAGAVLRFLLPGIIAYSMTPFFIGYFTQQMGKPTVQLLIASISTIICAVISLLTIRHWGIVAGAIATSISYSCAYVLSVVLFTRETGIPLRKLFVFQRDDLGPYIRVATSVWRRTAALVAGKP